MSDNEIIDGNPFGENVADQTAGNTADPQPEVEQPPIVPLPEPTPDGDLYILDLGDTTLGYTTGDNLRLEVVRQYLSDKGNPAKSVMPGDVDGEIRVLNDTGDPAISSPDWAAYNGTDSVTIYGQTFSGDAVEVTPELAATAYGHEAKATGESSTAIGRNAEATGDKSTAIGDHAESFGESTVAMGTDTRAMGGFSTAIGQAAITWGEYSTAMGYEAIVGAEFGGAMGDFNGTAIGAQSKATQEFTTAIGHLAEANGISSTSLGYNAKAENYFSMALGSNAEASANYGTAVGDRTVVDGAYGVALGASAEVHGGSGIAIGVTSSVTTGNDYGIAIGTGASADADGSIAIGFGAVITDARCAKVRANHLEVEPQLGNPTSIVLHDSAGARWRVSVSTGGALVVAAA